MLSYTRRGDLTSFLFPTNASCYPLWCWAATQQPLFHSWTFSDLQHLQQSRTPCQKLLLPQGKSQKTLAKPSHVNLAWHQICLDMHILIWGGGDDFCHRSVPPASCVGPRATPRGTVPVASAPPAASPHTGSGPARGPHCGTNTASAVAWLDTSLTWASLILSKVDHLLTFCLLTELKKKKSRKERSYSFS